MLTDQYWFYVFCQRDSSSEAGPIRARGCKEGETTPPHTLGPKGLTSNNKPKELVCLKHKHNNHKEERAERRLSWDCCVCQLCPHHNGAGPGARRSWGSRVLLQKTDAAHSAWRPFFQHNGTNPLPEGAGAQGSHG